MSKLLALGRTVVQTDYQKPGTEGPDHWLTGAQAAAYYAGHNAGTKGESSSHLRAPQYINVHANV